MTPASITQWLQEPNRNVAPDVLQDLLERYPYFTPLHYMAAAAKQEEGNSVQLSGHPDLYRGNWLLFYQTMQRASTVKEIEVEELIIASTAAFDEPEKIIEQDSETIIIPLKTDDIPVIEEPMTKEEESLIRPVFSENYFLHQCIPVEDSIPAELDAAQKEIAQEEQNIPADPKSLMVVMSFTEWLMHYKSKTQKEKEEEEDRKAVKHMWQKEKLAAALEEEDDEIPENVFEMAVNSISKEDGLVSESLAEILAKQGKWEKAIEMYRKLSLRNPQKSTYFAQQIAAIQKKSE